MSGLAFIGEGKQYHLEFDLQSPWMTQDVRSLIEPIVLRHIGTEGVYYRTSTVDFKATNVIHRWEVLFDSNEDRAFLLSLLSEIIQALHGAYPDQLTHLRVSWVHSRNWHYDHNGRYYLVWRYWIQSTTTATLLNLNSKPTYNYALDIPPDEDNGDEDNGDEDEPYEDDVTQQGLFGFKPPAGVS